MNCRNCGAPTEPVDGRNYLVCSYCYTFHFPTELEESADGIIPLEQTSDTPCPRCQTRLESGDLDGSRALFCRDCRGVLLNSDAFGALVRYRRARYRGPDDAPVPLDPQQLEVHRPCPLCRKSMDAHPYYGPGNVVIDSCSACHHVWLDHGEIAAIERAPGVRQQPAVSTPESSAQPEVNRATTSLLSLLLAR